jgi:hypothetical protein
MGLLAQCKKDSAKSTACNVAIARQE